MNLILNNPEGTIIAMLPCFTNLDGYLEADESDFETDLDICIAVEIALCHFNEGHMIQGQIDPEDSDSMCFLFSDE